MVRIKMYLGHRKQRKRFSKSRYTYYINMINAVPTRIHYTVQYTRRCVNNIYVLH